MLQDTTIIDSRYKAFIEKVTASKLVWGLKSKAGWANSNSVESEQINVIPFWSDRASAKACARDDWKNYAAMEIPLAEFLENWCVAMAENDTLVGVNWDAGMFGKEIDGLAIALDILCRLSENNSTITLRNYSSINEFITDIQEN